MDCTNMITKNYGNGNETICQSRCSRVVLSLSNLNDLDCGADFGYVDGRLQGSLVCLVHIRYRRLRAGESTSTSANLFSSEELGTVITAPLTPQTSSSSRTWVPYNIKHNRVAFNLHIITIIMSEKAGPGVGFEFPSYEVSWLKRDLLLFAASIGATYPDELHFLYVSHT
jgi:hypothetical protein